MPPGDPVAVGALLGAEGTVKARCAGCGEQHRVAQVAWDMAMAFHKRLIHSGQDGMSGVGRCEACSKLWEKEQEAECAAELLRDTAQFQRLRKAIAAAKDGRASREQIRRFVDNLPEGFVSSYQEAVASFRRKCDEAFSSGDLASTDAFDENFEGQA